MIKIVELYDWQMVNMIKGPNNKKVIDYISDKEKWKRKTEHEKNFFKIPIDDKI